VPQILDPITQHHVRQAADQLAGEFAGIFSPETIARYMAESTDLLGDAKFNTFVPVLAHRFCRERLRALAQAEGILGKEQPEVLFVCVHNAGRSQMAAGLLKLRSERRINVRSAGSAPGGEINPNAVVALEELGIDMSEAFPKPLTDEVVRAADVVITMDAAMPARSTPVSGTRTGSSTIRPARISRRCGGSATSSTCGCRS